MQSPRSLLLITVDCFRADHAGFLGYRRSTTPFLDSLAKESLVFSNAIVAGAPTYFSFPAVMASRYPLSLGRDSGRPGPGRADDRFSAEREPATSRRPFWLPILIFRPTLWVRQRL